MAGPGLTDRVEGMCGMQSAPQPSWPLFLSAAWPLVALKLRIKGHRKLPELILEWHLDGLGRPHQHLHHGSAASMTGQATEGSGNMYARVTARAARTRFGEYTVRRCNRRLVRLKTALH